MIYLSDPQIVPDWFLKLCVPATGLAGLFLGRLWDSHSASKKQRGEIVDRYLSQLQIASEALWQRIEGIKSSPEHYQKDSQYYKDSNAYVVGRVLAVERMMMEAGIYGTLHRHSIKYRKLNRFLQENRLDSVLINLGFHRFDRIALAEVLIGYSDGKHSVIGPDKFAQICAKRKSKGQELAESASKVVPKILDDARRTEELLAMLKRLSYRLSSETHIRVEKLSNETPGNSDNS